MASLIRKVRKVLKPRAVAKTYRKSTRMTKVPYVPWHTFKRHQASFYIVNAGSGVFTTVNVADTAFQPSLVLLGTPVGDGVLNTYALGMTMSFQLSQVIKFSEFTSLFDMYRILGVEIKVTNQMDSVGQSATGAGTIPGTIPQLHAVDDWDDAAILPTLEDAQEYESCKDFKLYNAKTVRFYVKPRSMMLTYKTSGTTIAYSNAPPDTWHDCSNSDIDHYAKKFYISGLAGANTGCNAIRFDIIYNLQFKNVR